MNTQIVTGSPDGQMVASVQGQNLPGSQLQEIQLAEYQPCCCPCMSGKTTVLLAGKQIRWRSETPDLLCCCITEEEADHDLRHVYAISRYTPSCWRKGLLCCFPCLSTTGVTYYYGGAGSAAFIRTPESKNVMNLIQARIDVVNNK